MAWDIEPGETLRRKEVHRRYDGQQQGGISTPKGNVMIFSDAARGSRFGYSVHEGRSRTTRFATPAKARPAT